MNEAGDFTLSGLGPAQAEASVGTNVQFTVTHVGGNSISPLCTGTEQLVFTPNANGQFALPVTNQYLRWGSSPRGSQALSLAGKVRALLEGRYNVSFEDIRRVFLPAMRHRIILNFEAQAEGIEPDQVLLEILEKLPEKDDSTPVAEVVA